MGQGYKKLTCLVLSFDKMSINQSLSALNPASCLSQAFLLLLKCSLCLCFFLPSCLLVVFLVFLSRLCVSLFNGSLSLTAITPSLYFSHWLLSIAHFSSSLLSFPSFMGFFSSSDSSYLRSLLPSSASPCLSHPLCYVCCLAALSFTCQLRSGLWSSNMTNCPLIHLHSHTHASVHTLVESLQLSPFFLCLSLISCWSVLISVKVMWLCSPTYSEHKIL